ncbi:hypothetical protein [Companilactobacillus insicii]|uniref:hypothetical protein n=1 Tax=Companilactobacillus insicii TaxID=1732567 RepID=UPI000F7A8EE0|nr:hypothetical protein [Companilactobacillus insicii]
MTKYIDVKYPDGSEKKFESISYIDNDATFLTLDNNFNEFHIRIPTQSVAPKLYFYVIDGHDINDSLIEKLPNNYTADTAFIRLFDGKYNIHAKEKIKLDGKYSAYISGDNIIFVKDTKNQKD